MTAIRAGARAASRFIDVSTAAGGAAGALALAVILVASLFEIVARKVGAPTLWSRDVTVYGMVVLTFLTLSAVERRGEHMNVDFVVMRLPSALSPAVRVGTRLISLAFLLLLAWQGWKAVEQSLQLDRSMIGGIGVPSYLLELMLPVGAFMMALEQARGLILLILDSKRLSRPAPAMVDPTT